MASFPCPECGRSMEMRQAYTLHMARRIAEIEVSLFCPRCEFLERRVLNYDLYNYNVASERGTLDRFIAEDLVKLRAKCPMDRRLKTTESATDGCSSHPRTTTDIRWIAPNCLSIRLNKSDDMRLMETIEDGNKAQIVLEDISPRDADAIHAFQLAGGKGRLVISESGITFED